MRSIFHGLTPLFKNRKGQRNTCPETESSLPLNTLMARLVYYRHRAPSTNRHLFTPERSPSPDDYETTNRTVFPLHVSSPDIEPDRSLPSRRSEVVSGAQISIAAERGCSTSLYPAQHLLNYGHIRCSSQQTNVLLHQQSLLRAQFCVEKYHLQLDLSFHPRDHYQNRTMVDIRLRMSLLGLKRCINLSRRV